MTNVTFIRPPCLVSKGTLQGPITPPIGVAYLAGSLNVAGHKPVIIDALGEAPFIQNTCFDDRMIAIGLPIAEIIVRIPADTNVIGFSCMFSQDWPYTQQIVQAIRRQYPRVLIVAGGEHITAMPLHTLESCPEIDVCVLGEGEEVMVDIANCVATERDFSSLTGIAFRRDGKIIQNPPRARLKALDEIPQPAWDITPIAN